LGRRISPLKFTQVELLNPLPGGVTKEDILSLCGFFDPKASNELAFKVEYKWQGAGVDHTGTVEYDELVLEPGESAKMEEKVANTILKTVADLGIVKISPTDNLLRKKIEGLQRAKNHYNLHGSVGYMKFQDRNNYSEEQMSRNRNVIKPYIINIEKEKLIQAEIDRLEQGYLAERSTRKLKE